MHFTSLLLALRLLVALVCCSRWSCCWRWALGLLIALLLITAAVQVALGLLFTLSLLLPLLLIALDHARRAVVARRTGGLGGDIVRHVGARAAAAVVVAGAFVAALQIGGGRPVVTAVGVVARVRLVAGSPLTRRLRDCVDLSRAA